MQGIQEHAIQSWIVTHLAEQLGLSPEAIDVRKPFTEYGLDSIVGVSLAGDLEDWLGLQLSATVLWDHPTTEALAHYLVVELPRQGSAAKETAAMSQHAQGHLHLAPEEAEQLLSTLDGLSDAEVDALLHSLLAPKALAA
jgi:acyl carrier protein